MHTIVIEDLTPRNETSLVKMNEDIARFRLLRRIATRSNNQISSLSLEISYHLNQTNFTQRSALEISVKRILTENFSQNISDILKGNLRQNLQKITG